MTDLFIGRRAVAGLLAMAVLLAGCGAAGASPSDAPASAPPDTPVSAPPDDGSGGGGGAGAPVVPKPGQLDVHPVAATSLSATADGSTIVVTATWTSGVEPCYVLDSIIVERGDAMFTVTLQEGRGPGDVMCIEIAQDHRTVFEIPDVAPGTYVIRDGAGGAPDAEVTVV